jgi:hypothetical protein
MPLASLLKEISKAMWMRRLVARTTLTAQHSTLAFLNVSSVYPVAMLLASSISLYPNVRHQSLATSSYRIDGIRVVCFNPSSSSSSTVGFCAYSYRLCTEPEISRPTCPGQQTKEQYIDRKNKRLQISTKTLWIIRCMSPVILVDCSDAGGRLYRQLIYHIQHCDAK